MTAPDKIWATPDRASDSYGTWDCAGIGEYDDRAEYTRTDLAQAAIAAAYEAAAKEADGIRQYYATATYQNPDARMQNAAITYCADEIAIAIRALATPDQSTALAAKVDASQAPNPAVNGGSCQSDPITLSRAEVEALMEAVNEAAITIDYAYGTTDDDGYLDRKYSAFLRKALTDLQERMK